MTTSAYTRVHLCGIGGSGMLPLAMILLSRGVVVSGSDRSFDQGRTPEKFEYLQSQGVRLFPQDGSGITDGLDALVVSTAVEESIPDVRAALEQGLPIIRRANLLANLFNQAETRIAVAGTSGKSTTTAMIGYVLQRAGLEPTVMNGAIFRNFQTETNPYSTALTGRPDFFVTEADESDGSIALYTPSIAVLNNIALDHKSMDELVQLFTDFVGKAGQAVLNLDNESVARIAAAHPGCMTYSLTSKEARLQVEQVQVTPEGISCLVQETQFGNVAPIDLKVPGRHNISNALACIGACLLLDLNFVDVCEYISDFTGVKRRLEIVGTRNGVTVIDDFAHNPDKIAASLATLKEAKGRLLVIFQIHGYNPIRLMRKEFAEVFAAHLGPEDRLFIPEVLYLGGTVDRSVTAEHLVADMTAAGVHATWIQEREDAIPLLLGDIREGDRIVVMGARDDTLSDYAREILSRM